MTLGYFDVVSTISEIESAIRDLPQEEFWKLAEWFDEVKADAWDAQIEADAKAGRLRAALLTEKSGMVRLGSKTQHRKSLVQHFEALKGVEVHHRRDSIAEPPQL